jgi:hypothetical protein
MNFDPKAIRRALMIAKDLAVKIDPGFAVHNLPMPPQGVPLERADGGSAKGRIAPEQRIQNLANFMEGAHPEFLNEDGTARRFYHATPRNFKVFKPGGMKAQQQLSGPAIFMTPDAESQHAAHNIGGYGGEFKEGTNVMPLHANIKNPLIITNDNYKQLRQRYPDMGFGAYILSPEVKTDLEERGYDGIINKINDDPMRHEFMAFYPWQVKSAIGNRGTFDRREDDITKAEGGIVEDDDMPARKLNDMGMYSAAAEAARNLPQERGTLQQMLATMKGVKPDEIDWSGVQQKFAGQKTVTRDELAQHFENNMPPVQDNIRSRQTRIGMVPKYDAYTIPGGQNYQEFVLHMPKEDVEKAYPGEVMYFRSSHWSEPNVIAHLRTKDRMLTQREKLPKSDTQIDIALRDPTEPKRTVSAWTTQTPGLAVTKSLDEKGLYNVTHIGSGLATNTQVGSLPFRQAMDAARRLGEYYDGWTSPGDEIKAQLQQKLPEIKNIISSSINPSAKKALHLEELQSDWAQKGRDESFVDSEKVKKANAELQNYRQSMRDEYERSLIDRLQKGQPIKDEEKEQMLAGQYKDLYDLRKSFEDTQGAKIDTGNEYQVRTIFPDVRELPFENDKKGLFLYDNNSGEIIDDEKLWPDSQDRLNRMRKAFEEIQNFEKYAKENPEWLAENVNEYVYGLEPKIVARHLGDHAFAKHVRMTDDLNNMLKGIDEGPFVTSTNQWTDLGLKRALVEAARGNYDKLIWTPGKEQAQRYKLNNFIDALSYKKSDDGYYDIVASKRGNKVHSDRYKPEDLPGVVGQEMAKKIISGEGDDKPDPVNPSAGKGSKFIRGVDLNVGGRGMYEYYDKILPRRLLALAQEHDPEAKILPTSNTVGKLNKFPSLDITPRMRQSILKRGFRMFARGGAVQKHLFDQAIEPAQVNVPEMDSQKTIRRALMIAKQEGGGIKGKTMRGSELQQKMARAGQEPVRFSSLKSSVPFPEMQAQYVSKQSLSPFAGLNPEQLQREGAVIIPAVGDRSMAGQILTHIGEIPLTKPIDLQGGAEFQRSEFEPAVWASQKGVISRIARKAAYAGKEGAPVYMSHVAMAPGGADASHMMVQALLRQIPSLKISKQAKNDFNQKIQEIDGLEEFPGVHKPEQAEAFLMGKSMKHRKAFAEEMDKARWSKENFPDVAQTRFAITEPRLMTAKTGATGFSFGRIDPAFEAIKDPERKHESYDTQLRGAGYAGGLTSQVPMSVMFPDWYAQQSKQTQADPVLSLYSLTRQLPTQQASQEWLDQLMSHLENMPEKWGYKKGGKVGKK